MAISITHARVSESEGVVPTANVYGGKGTIDIGYFFRHEGFAEPALLLIYTLPPGASEGMHTHGPGEEAGSFDEFYYVISGSGEMSVDGDCVQVTAGDYVYVPNGVPHGIANTSGTHPLKVHLTALTRD